MTSKAYEVRERVAIITLDNPPVNGLGHALRSAIVSGLDRANADTGVDAIAITGAGKTFSGGADIREFDTRKSTAEPTLRTVIGVVESSTKPVVAAINATCMGGGLELALGCHYRVAFARATVALPEVKLGLMPGAGGTQRFPRAVGIETALNMIVTGVTVPAAQLQDTALFDVITDGDTLIEALALARRVVAEKLPRKRIRDLAVEHPNAEAYLQFARNTLAVVARDFPAPGRCVDAVAAATTQSFDEGLRIERELFLQLLQTPQARALRHAFFAERAAARLEGVLDDTRARKVDRVAVIGAGTMGAGIAVNFVNAGIPVALLETSPQALEKGVAAIRAIYEAAASKRRISRDDVHRNMALVTPTLAYEDVGDADLVIEAVYEDLEVKREVFETLGRIMKPGAILATNTSTLDVDRLASFTGRPHDVVGLHFFSPAHVMKLLEVVRGEATAPDVLTSVMQVAKRIGKTAVVARVCDGFIGNRMIEPYLRQAMLLVEEGAAPEQVDAALERFGMAMGPFRMSDLAGLDVGWRIRQRRYVERPDVAYSRIADRLYERGRYGQKTGAGWYRYETGRRDAVPDPAIAALIADYRIEIGVKPREIDGDEMVDRCILALVNEGARILDEGIAQRASDIDVIYLAGYGFPRHRGGPMFYADARGLFGVVRRMKAFAAAPRGDATFWTPAPLLSRLVAEGRTFNE